MCVCMHTTCTQCLRGQKWALDSLALELLMVVHHHVGAGNQIPIFRKSSTCS